MPELQDEQDHRVLDKALPKHVQKRMNKLVPDRNRPGHWLFPPTDEVFAMPNHWRPEGYEEREDSVIEAALQVLEKEDLPDEDVTDALEQIKGSLSVDMDALMAERDKKDREEDLRLAQEKAERLAKDKVQEIADAEEDTSIPKPATPTVTPVTSSKVLKVGEKVAPTHKIGEDEVILRQAPGGGMKYFKVENGAVTDQIVKTAGKTVTHLEDEK